MIRRKTILLLVLYLVLGVSWIRAQSIPLLSDNNRVSLNIVLNPIQTIVVNPMQGNVDLEYVSTEDYSEGVINEQQNHITIYSTGGFEVNVASSDDYLVGVNKNISTSDIKILASQGSNNILHDVNYMSDVSLSSSPTCLLSSSTGGVDQSFNVSYEAAGDDKYINHFNDKSASTSIFTTIVTYSIVTR